MHALPLSARMGPRPCRNFPPAWRAVQRLAGRPTMRPIQPILLVLLLGVIAAHAEERGAPWQPSPGHQQIPIWPGTPPDATPNPKPETGDAGGGAFDVSRPTMTVYAAQGRNTGIAMIV